MTKIEKPGTARVGEFSPAHTPLNTGEVVTTAKDQAQNHRHKPDNTGPTGSMTATDNTPVRVIHK